ncbi:thioredoxin family protein [Clostridium ihumii]|uniref:thioredoxin family protein n=1 Tax=Clostridium ihumii TaxID=1470356 RepID=UPI0005903C17|nr:thioredoxin family protein [Clostridium ihumii]
MKNVNNEQDVLDTINNNTMTVVYFSGKDCGACDVIKTKVENILKYYPKIENVEIDGEKNIELSAQFNVFSLPIFLLYINGKETLRIGRNVDLLELESKIKRYYNMLF